MSAMQTLAFIGGLALVISLAVNGVLSWLLHRHRSRTCKAKVSYQSIESRCRGICDAIGETWPEIGELRGEPFIAGLKLRLAECATLHTIIQATIDTRPAAGTLFDSIEAVRFAASKVTELERCRKLLDEASVGTSGLNLPSKAGVAERVSLLANMVKRMKSAIGNKEESAPAFVWIPAGLERKAADMLCAFGTELAAKMYRSQRKIREDGGDPSGWSRKGTGWPVPDGQFALLEHLAKGDPLDVALFAAFLWYHEEETSLMGYMSMTPALEDAVRLTIATTEPEAVNKLARSGFYHGSDVRANGQSDTEAFEALSAQYREGIATLADYAPNVTFTGDLRQYIHAAMQVHGETVRNEARQTEEKNG